MSQEPAAATGPTVGDSGTTTPVTDGAAAAAVEGKPMRATEAMIFGALSEVYDPELGIDIVSLGLVYAGQVDESGELSIDMTLTSPYCPMGSIIQSQAHAVCMPLAGVSSVRVNLVWSPPWDPRTMASEEARLMLGIY